MCCHYVWTIIALTLANTVSAIIVCVTHELTPDSSHEPKVAIVDELYAFDHPNQELIEQKTDTLESSGFHIYMSTFIRVTRLQLAFAETC